MIKQATSIMMRLAQIQIELMELSQDYARDGSKHGSEACDTARLHVNEAQRTIHMNLKPPGFPKLSTLPSVGDPYRFQAPWHTGYFEGPESPCSCRGIVHTTPSVQSQEVQVQCGACGGRWTWNSDEHRWYVDLAIIETWPEE